MRREDALYAVFAAAVPVLEVRLPRDKFSGAPRGFAFVHCASITDAGRALQLLQGATVPGQGSTLRLCYARERAPTGVAADALQARADTIMPCCVSVGDDSKPLQIFHGMNGLAEAGSDCCMHVKQ